jgi:hypothetical protein
MEILYAITFVYFTGTWKQMNKTNYLRVYTICVMFIGIPLSSLGLFYGLTFNFICIMSFISHLRAAFTNPGIIEG